MIWYLDSDPVQKTQECAVPLGVQGENLSLAYTANVSDWLERWPSGVVALVLQPPDKSAPYMADTSLDRETGIITWTITAFDTAIVGYGMGELRIVEGGIVKKSWRFATYTRPSVLVCAAVPPPPVPDWIRTLMEELSGVPDLLEQAEAARDAAAESAERAEQAAQNAGYLDFEIDEHGHLIFQRTDNTDVDFELQDGRLIALWL